MIEKLTRYSKILIIISSSICLSFFLLVALEGKFHREWQKYQKDYQSLLETHQDSIPQGYIFDIEIRQIELPELNVVDRCISCHLGVENPFLKAATSPLKTHSGEYLNIHSPERFGCTLCHRGKSRVLEVQEVCNPEKKEHTILSLQYIQSTCGRCHLAIFEENLPLVGTEVLLSGLKIFRQEGCLGCHKVRQVGGTLGPDLTNQGDKIKQAYSFKYIEGNLTIPNWLREHFQDPARVSPGSLMLPFDFGDAEMDAIVTFTLGLFKPNLPLGYYSFSNLREFKSRRVILSGEEIFGLFCSACHGKNGEGRNYENEKFGVPTLNNQDFQAVASRDLVEFTIIHGRGKRQMASWAPILSGLSKKEIQEVVSFIKRWQEVSPAFETVAYLTGELDKGTEIYRRDCQMCHGPNGEGGIGPTINNQDFLTIASDRFIYLMIVVGRSNTAMPAWSQYSADEVKNVIQYLRSWQNVQPQKLSNQNIIGDVLSGQRLYDHLCIRCHGKSGSGGIGPAIMNRDFLEAASDQYLFQTISRGRSHTTMFGWASDLGKLERLTVDNINDLVAFIRAHQDTLIEFIYPGESLGDPKRGETLFRTYCTDCHGKMGEGVKAPALNNQEFLNAATNGFILATISLGKRGTAMPSWGRGSEKYKKLSGEERQHITAYIRGWQELLLRR